MVLIAVSPLLLLGHSTCCRTKFNEKAAYIVVEAGVYFYSLICKRGYFRASRHCNMIQQKRDLKASYGPFCDVSLFTNTILFILHIP